METAEFFREKAQQCRAMAVGAYDINAIARGLHALALELDARALAMEAGEATAREIDADGSRRPDGNGEAI